MRICWKGFLGKNHSWSIVAQNLSRELLNLGHDVDLFSTNGISHFPEDLKKNLIGYTEEHSHDVIGKNLDKNYDCQLSYTCMKNFPNHLSNGNKNKFGIWCYEWKGKNVLPNGFAKNYKYCDALLAPSNFAKEVFLDSGIPENIIKVIPHGINSVLYKQKSKINLKTNKNFKILANIAQNHLRKNIPGLLEAFGKTFNKKDDVVLILKAKDKQPKYDFEISLSDCLNKFKKQFPNHAEILILSDFIIDMSELYRSIDVVFTMTHSECFFMPGLEAIASGKLVIAPNWGGQIDFLNESNSLLISGQETRANPKSTYYEPRYNAIWFQPDINDAVEKLKFAYSNFESLNNKISQNMNLIHHKYDWKNISNLIMNYTT